MSFSVDTIDLSLASPETGEYLTANVYYVDGVTDGLGGLRPLSIGQLVMAICLQRASDLEAQIVEMMEVMNTTSAQLKDMTDIEQAVIDYFSNNPSSHAYSVNNVPVTTATSAQALLQSLDIFNSSQEYVRDNASDVNNYMLYDEFITKIESKMDDMNSFSQQKMIELQSLTNKRDQSYDMISNILKSLNTVMTGIVNNT